MKRVIKRVVSGGIVTALLFASAFELQLIGNDPIQSGAVVTADNMPDIQGLVINTGETETDLNFTWFDNTGDDGVVYMAKKTDNPDELDESGFPKEILFSADAEKTEKIYKDDKSKVYADYDVNKATISGIERGVDYVYCVANGDTYSDIYDFKLRGTVDNWSFYYSGDPQLPNVFGSENTIVKQWISTMNKVTELNEECSLLVTGGDLADSGGAEEAQYFDGFLAPERIKSLAVASSVGNHDQRGNGYVYVDHFNQPHQTEIGTYNHSNGDYYYTYNNAVFVHLTTCVNTDTNLTISYADEHAEFIRQAFEENPECDWHIVVFHEALFSQATHAAGDYTRKTRAAFMPLFDEIDKDLGIDIVLNAHDHHYSRTKLLQNVDVIEEEDTSETWDPDGIYYITANTGSGVKYYDKRQIDFDYLVYSEQQYTPNISNVELETDPYNTSLHITTYRTAEGSQYKGTGESMSVVDEFTIHKTAGNKKTGESKVLEDANTHVKINVPNIFSQDKTTLDVKEVKSGAAYENLNKVFQADSKLNPYVVDTKVLDVDTKWCDNDLSLEDNLELFIPFDAITTKAVKKDAAGQPLFAIYQADANGGIYQVNYQTANKDGKDGIVVNTTSTGVYGVAAATADKPVVTPPVVDGGVKPAPAAKKATISVAKKTITLKAKKSAKIKATLKNAAKGMKLKFKSSNKKVAKVSAKGVVKALKKGKAVITISATGGKVKAVKVTVKVK